VSCEALADHGTDRAVRTAEGKRHFGFGADLEGPDRRLGDIDFHLEAFAIDQREDRTARFDPFPGLTVDVLNASGEGGP
jgi:hypothetical protein